ncbi:MAG: ADP-ribosyl-(dinitrogen reductase) hydrolase [Methylophilaceae bacterium]|jgi:hypothetical protein|nr:ADP-ribosyl-(dinitrogen reductase) hydrolase [Methylophilaceae bacterium]
MPIKISTKILTKLATKEPPVSEKEIIECFNNRIGGLLQDTREQHETDPPTQWFVAETNHRRKLKVIFVQDGETIFIKSAYDASPEIVNIYKKYACGT